MTRTLEDARKRIILPLDVSTVSEAYSLVEELEHEVGYFKIGLELMTTMLVEVATAMESTIHRSVVVEQIQGFFKRLDGRFFWDWKLKDIGKTTARSMRKLHRLRPWMINIHATASNAAIKAAVDARGSSFLVGVTILTDIPPKECEEKYGDTPEQMVVKLARRLQDCGANGLICSPLELEALNQDETITLPLRVTPGVRPEFAKPAGQVRYTTPARAIKLRASHLVIGDPILNPPAKIGTRVDAARLIAHEIAEALE